MEARVEALSGGRSSTLRDRALEFGAFGPSSPCSRKVTEELQGCVEEGFTAEGIFPELPDTFPNGLSECVLPSDRSAVAAETGLVAGCLYGALPVAIAVFPQEMTIPVGSLEPEFVGRRDSSGRPVEVVRCNKGL